MIRKTAVLLILYFSTGLFTPGVTVGKTVVLPITIDYPLLGALVVKQAFTDPDRSSVLMDEAHGCRRIVVSEPVFSMVDGRLRFESRVFLRMGFAPGGTCLFPLEWEGYVVLFQRPVLDGRWTLSFETLDSKIYDLDRNPDWLAGFIWDRAKTAVYEYLEQITIDLAPPVSQLKSFLEPLFPASRKERAERLIASMRPGEARAASKALKAEILADVEETYEPEKVEPEEVVTADRLRTFVSIWQAWDVSLIRIMLALSGEPLTEADRQILLDTLLETRHEFTARLIEKKSQKDFVRIQFVDAWKKLSPLYRRHLADDPSKTLLNYLAFFTASDALVALDRIGPTLGIEISRNGLIRLLGMIRDEKILPLDYLPEVVPELRQILGLGPLITVNYPDSKAMRRSPVLGEKIIRFGRLLVDVLIPETCAHQSIPEGRIRSWIVPRERPGPYIEKVRRLLTEIVEQVLAASKLPGEHHDLYRRLVPSTAWQESCFRQFEKKNGGVSYLVSYNGTSVGIMQINERVWRGIYDLRKLRWDIRYNTKAGCEILDIYFNRYVLKKIQDQTISKALVGGALARVLYAMYNGGPGQFRKFLKRHASGKYYLSDRLFCEKFKWVTDGQWEKIGECL